MASGRSFLRQAWEHTPHLPRGAMAITVRPRVTRTGHEPRARKYTQLPSPSWFSYGFGVWVFPHKAPTSLHSVCRLVLTWVPETRANRVTRLLRNLQGSPTGLGIEHVFPPSHVPGCLRSTGSAPSPFTQGPRPQHPHHSLATVTASCSGHRAKHFPASRVVLCIPDSRSHQGNVSGGYKPSLGQGFEEGSVPAPVPAPWEGALLPVPPGRGW